MSRTFGSLSRSSRDTQANASPSRAAHCASSVVLPYPDGATTETIGGEPSAASRPISEERGMVPGRAAGRRSLEVIRSNPGLAACRGGPGYCRTPFAFIPPKPRLFLRSTALCSAPGHSHVKRIHPVQLRPWDLPVEQLQLPGPDDRLVAGGGAELAEYRVRL